MEAERIANIGTAGRRRRFIGGVVWAVVGAVGFGIIARAHARLGWYALLVLPFTLAALGYFQATTHT
jgi:hypothetical protein